MDDKHEVVQLNLNDIIPNRFQPREVFDEKALKELAVSIKEHGVIQPIIVRKVNDKYEIIAGERRYKASALAGMTKIPAIVRELDDKESSKVALLENLQRKNLNPIEEARTYQKILEIDEMTQEELAKTMGKSQSAVANKIRLLSLSDDIQNALLKEQISERHARTLLNVEDEEEQKKLLKEIIDTKMSVRVLEEKIKSMKEENVREDNQIDSINQFLNTNPINPNVEMPKEEEYGKVTIAPPDSEPTDASASAQKIDEAPKTEDIEKTDTSTADLDNLLNINSTGVRSEATEAEKIVKEESTESNEKIEDYFKPTDIGTVEVPQIEEVAKKEEYTIQDGIDKIKELTTNLTNSGLKVSMDEMNFDSSYQVIIKIEKE